MDKFSYGLGMGIGQNLLSMGVQNMNVDDFVKALKDVLTGAKTEMSHSEAQAVVNEHFRKLAEELMRRTRQLVRLFLPRMQRKRA